MPLAFTRAVGLEGFCEQFANRLSAWEFGRIT